MRSHLATGLVAAAALAASCGGDTTIADGGGGGSGATTSSSSSSSGQGGDGGAGASSSSSSSSNGTGGGCSSQSGECQTDDHCLNGGCVELTPCGYKVCETVIDEATGCGTAFDECCSSADCPGGSCYLGPWAPYCGGPQQAAHNICAADECSSDGDCPAPPPELLVICAPANTLGYPVRHCLLGSCRTNADCTDEPGGICATITPTCCSGPSGLFCTYPSDGCRSDSDCVDGHCAVEAGRAHCVGGVAVCPD